MKKFYSYPITYILYIALSFSFGISLALSLKNIFLSYIFLIVAFILIILSLIFAFFNKTKIYLAIISCFFIGYSFTIARYYKIFINPLSDFEGDIKGYRAKIKEYEGVINFRDRYIAYVDMIFDGKNWLYYSGNIKNIIKNLDNKMLYGVSSIYPYINFTVQKSGFSIINYINKYGLYFRNIAKKSLGKFLSPINYSVAQGITIGDKSIIPKNINQYFIGAGISHILSISGLHISMVLYILFIALSFLPINFYKRILISTIITIIIYPAITLFSVSIIRASIMAFCLLISFIFDKNRNSVNSLFLAALIILTIEPNSIREISFQFSFLATLGIILYYPIFDFYILSKIKNVDNVFLKNLIIKLVGFLFINLIALISILPFSVYHFSILNLTSIFANVFAVPLAFIILSSSIITIIIFQIYSPLSIYPASTVEFFTNLLIKLSKNFSEIKFFKYQILCNLYFAIFLTFIIMIIGLILRVKINSFIKEK
ncbi:MAG: ComEC/Rec2 family competence protein [Brachyspira sp.]|nr:ComEC/Rec2 family competence protein [Brachyspira sp.]